MAKTAVSKSQKKILEGKYGKLSMKEELFCRLYVFSETTYGNGTLSYAEAYGYDLDNIPDDDAIYEQVEKEIAHPDGSKEVVYEDGKLLRDSSRNRAKNSCGVMAHNLLRKIKIIERVDELRADMLNDRTADAALFEMMRDKSEPATRMAAVREWNRMKGRVIEKMELTGANGGAITLEEKKRTFLDKLLKKNEEA